MTSFDLFLLRKNRDWLKQDQQNHIDKVVKITKQLAEIEAQIKDVEKEQGIIPR